MNLKSHQIVNLKLFGVMRKYSSAPLLQIELPQTCPVSDLPIFLAEKLRSLHPGFQDIELIHDCAFATEDRILGKHELVPTVAFIAVLPPVCGG